MNIHHFFTKGFICLFPDVHFFYQVIGMAHLVYKEEDVADIAHYCAFILFIESYIAAHGFPVTVECGARQFAIGIHNRTAGVAAGDVVVGYKAGMQCAIGIGIAAIILGFV